MSDDSWDDDEDWTDDEDDELDEEEAARCPECGGPIYSISDKCPRCGYWLSYGDQRAMWAGMSKPIWIKIAAVIVLVAFVTVFVLAVAF